MLTCACIIALWVLLDSRKPNATGMVQLDQGEKESIQNSATTITSLANEEVPVIYIRERRERTVSVEMAGLPITMLKIQV